MNHNQFDYECDLIFPFKDFLRRHTGFKSDEIINILLPYHIYEIPLEVKQTLKQIRYRKKVSGFKACFGGGNYGNIDNSMLDQTTTDANSNEKTSKC